MKKLLIFMTVLAMCSYVSGYRKFRCADYMKVPNSQRDVCSAILNKITPHNTVVSYTMTDPYGMSYVYLSASDKKRIIHALSRYETTTNITHDLIRQFTASSRKRSNVVGLVLHDIATLKDKATVHDVLFALHHTK